jgi:hypothetical protein
LNTCFMTSSLILFDAAMQGFVQELQAKFF